MFFLIPSPPFFYPFLRLRYAKNTPTAVTITPATARTGITQGIMSTNIDVVVLVMFALDISVSIVGVNWTINMMIMKIKIIAVNIPATFEVPTSRPSFPPIGVFIQPLMKVDNRSHHPGLSIHRRIISDIPFFRAAHPGG